MSDDCELIKWSEEDILRELKYLLNEGFIQIVEKDNEHYFVIPEDADNVDEWDEIDEI